MTAILVNRIDYVVNDQRFITRSICITKGEKNR